MHNYDWCGGRCWHPQICLFSFSPTPKFHNSCYNSINATESDSRNSCKEPTSNAGEKADDFKWAAMQNVWQRQTMGEEGSKDNFSKGQNIALLVLKTSVCVICMRRSTFHLLPVWSMWTWAFLSSVFRNVFRPSLGRDLNQERNYPSLSLKCDHWLEQLLWVCDGNIFLSLSLLSQRRCCPVWSVRGNIFSPVWPVLQRSRQDIETEDSPSPILPGKWQASRADTSRSPSRGCMGCAWNRSWKYSFKHLV